MNKTVHLLLLAFVVSLVFARNDYGLYSRHRRRILSATSAPSVDQTSRPTSKPTSSPSATPTSLPTTPPTSEYPAPSPQPTHQAFLPTGENAYGNKNATTGPWPECIGWACEDCKSYILSVAEGNPNTRCVSGDHEYHRVVIVTNQHGVVVEIPSRG